MTNIRTAEASAKRSTHPWLETLVAALDSRLRQQQGVFEYTRNRDCLFRIQIVTSNGNFVLSDGVQVRTGDRLIKLHVWNEQFPAFPKDRPTLAWARRVDRAFVNSLRELAGYLHARQALDDVVAICAIMGFSPERRSGQLARYVARFGLEPAAQHADEQSLQSRIHLFGENVLISMMVLARNASALRADTLWRDRTRVFMSRRELQRRYAPDAPERHGSETSRSATAGPAPRCPTGAIAEPAGENICAYQGGIRS